MTSYPPFYSIKPGDIVTVADRTAQATRTGKALKLGRGGWVIGTAGYPALATPANTLKVSYRIPPTLE